MADPFVSLLPSAADPRVPAGFIVDGNGNLLYDGVTPIPNVSRQNLNRLRALQFAMHRRAFDFNGVIGAQGDHWYRYGTPRDRSINIVTGTTWKIVSAVGSTLEIEALDGDARRVLESFWDEKEQVLNLYWVTGFQEHGSLSPGNMVVFNYPSGAHNRMVARVEQILYGDATTYELRLDKAVDVAEDVFLRDPDTETPPAYLTCTTYTYGMREGEKWDYVINPNKFYGVRVQKPITAAELPSNKIWRLEEGAVASPAARDDLDDPNFRLEGYNGSSWHIINEPTRLHSHHTLGSDVALGTELPAGSVRSPFADLTLTYSQFRVTYWRESDGTEAGCSDRGWYCFNSRQDLSASVGNVVTDNGRYVEGGKHYYCDTRVVDDNTETVDDYDRGAKAPGTDGIPDRVINKDKFAEGKAAYRYKCMQYGYCSLMEEVYARGLSDPQAPYDIDHKTGRVLMGVLGAADIKIQQPYVLAQTYDATRVGHPSIMYLNGYYGLLKTMDGWHPELREWRGYAGWANIDEPTEATTAIVPKLGFERLFNWANDVAFDTSQKAFFPAAGGTGYTTKRNPMQQGATVNSDMLEILGVEIERDTGVLHGRGLARNTQAIGPLTIELTNIPIESPVAAETWEASYVKPAGKDAVFTIKPLRQLAKTEENLGTRTIYSQEWDVMKEAWKFEGDNTYKTFSRKDLGDLATIGDTYDKIYTVACGGGPVIRPYEGQAINSIYTEVNRTGSRLAGLSPGDVMQVDGKRFVVIDAAPFAGSEATTWGNRRLSAKGWTSGFWTPAGLTEARAPIVIDTITNYTDTVVMTAVEGDEKPPTLGLNEFWFDGRERVYFSSLAHNKFIQIDWTDAEEDDDTTFITLNAYRTLDFDIDYSEYTAADTATVTIGGTTSTVITSGDPDAGEVKLEDVGGKIRATFNIDDAGNDSELRITLMFSTVADDPEDDWTFDNDFLAYGRRRDVWWCVDDQAHLESVSTVGMEPEFFRSAAVWVPGSTVIEYKTSGDWTAVPTDKRIASGAAGTVTIDHAWLTGLGVATLSGLRARDVALFDHRGTVPASLLNKLEWMAAQFKWMRAQWGTGYGDFSMSQSAGINFNIQTVPETGCTLADPLVSSVDSASFDFSVGNYFYVDMGSTSLSSARNEVRFGIQTFSSFGIPKQIQNLPDGCANFKAWAWVTSTGLVRFTWEGRSPLHNCNEGVVTVREPAYAPDPVFSNEDISYSIIGFTGPKSFEVVGSLPGAMDGPKLVEMSAIVELMYTHRNSDKYRYGFGAIFLPAALSGGADAASLVPMDLPEIALDMVGDCSPCGRKHVMPSWSQEHIDWGGIEIDSPWIHFDYPPGYLESGFVQPALPILVPEPV